MGIVSEYVRNLVAKQVDEHGIVVWYNPDKHYEHLAAMLSVPGTTVARYDGSYFELRHRLEPLISGLKAPRLIVYLPIDQAAFARGANAVVGSTLGTGSVVLACVKSFFARSPRARYEYHLT